jgi:CDP-diacylglycerol---glycerol-3-phosphate 3-phosphatidyltransferase
MTLADKVTLMRLWLAPLIVAAYLLLPIEHNICFWVAGLLCGFAEFTDYLDGKIARSRQEVSDFGKLADPFCDVFYRLSVFFVFLLPAGGAGYPVPLELANDTTSYAIKPLIFAVGRDEHGVVILGAGLAPWLPVLLMVLRELVAGAMRSMAATKGLVMAARWPGKLKAWLQGVALITTCALPAFWGGLHHWHLVVAYWACWVCAIASVLSMAEYLWTNRDILRQLTQRRAAP